MNVERPRKTTIGWIHHAARRDVSPNRRRTSCTGTADTAMPKSSQVGPSRPTILAVEQLFKRGRRIVVLLAHAAIAACSSPAPTTPNVPTTPTTAPLDIAVAWN